MDGQNRLFLLTLDVMHAQAIPNLLKSVCLLDRARAHPRSLPPLPFTLPPLPARSHFSAQNHNQCHKRYVESEQASITSEMCPYANAHVRACVRPCARLCMRADSLLPPTESSILPTYTTPDSTGWVVYEWCCL